MPCLSIPGDPMVSSISSSMIVRIQHKKELHVYVVVSIQHTTMLASITPISSIPSPCGPCSMMTAASHSLTHHCSHSPPTSY